MKKFFIGFFIFLAAIISWNICRSVKYYVMKKEYAAGGCYYTTGTQMEKFCRENWVLDVQMDKSDYILIKYL